MNDTLISSNLKLKAELEKYQSVIIFTRLSKIGMIHRNVIFFYIPKNRNHLNIETIMIAIFFH